MQVLLTSAGRRGSIVKLFRAANDPAGQVIAADMSGLAPAAYLADAAEPVPRVTDAGYIPRLLQIIDRYKVELLVPLIDTELPILARHEAEFTRAGCRLALSQQALVDISCDKDLTMQHFGAQGVQVPRSWVSLEQALDEAPHDLFIKPRDGSASLHTYACTRDNLREFWARVPNPIVQQRLTGQEITIDALHDFSGVPLHYVARKRIRTVGGESIIGVTIQDPRLHIWILQVLRACQQLGARGPTTLQAFLEPDGYVLSEINPRFGGGFPLAYAAGGRYPDWLMALVRGQNVPAQLGQYEYPLYMTRYYEEIFAPAPKF